MYKDIDKRTCNYNSHENSAARPSIILLGEAIYNYYDNRETNIYICLSWMPFCERLKLCEQILLYDEQEL